MKKLLHGVEIEVDQHAYIPAGCYIWAEGNLAGTRWQSLDSLSVEYLTTHARRARYLVSCKEFARLWLDEFPETSKLLRAGKKIGQPLSTPIILTVPTTSPSCECGSDVAKLPTHSTWCPKYV